MTLDASERSRLTRRGLIGSRAAVHRPPWTNERRVRTQCSSCGDCIRACPEAILIDGPAGTPKIDFNLGACTFCGACADVCRNGVFTEVGGTPWSLTATIGPDCLLNAGIACRTCTDACDEDALRFDMRGGVAGQVSVKPSLCTGCGACLSTCPVKAISLSDAKAIAA